MSKKKDNLTTSIKGINTKKNFNNQNSINKNKKLKVRRRDTFNEVIYNKNRLSVLYEIAEYQNKKKKEVAKNIDENSNLENKNNDDIELFDDDAGEEEEEEKNYTYNIKNLKIRLGSRIKKLDNN